MAIASPTKLLAGDLASSFSFSRSSANPKLLSSSSPSRVYFAAPKTRRFQVFAFAVKRSPKRLKYSGPRFTKEDELLYVEVDPSGDDSWKLEPVLDLLKQGAVGVVPTDTVYAIVCDPRNHSAVDRLCRIKKIESTKPLTILCHSSTTLIGLQQASLVEIPKVMQISSELLSNAYLGLIPSF